MDRDLISHNENPVLSPLPKPPHFHLMINLFSDFSEETIRNAQENAKTDDPDSVYLLSDMEKGMKLAKLKKDRFGL